MNQYIPINTKDTELLISLFAEPEQFANASCELSNDNQIDWGLIIGRAIAEGPHHHVLYTCVEMLQKTDALGTPIYIAMVNNDSISLEILMPHATPKEVDMVMNYDPDECLR